VVLSPLNDYSKRHANPRRCSIPIRLVVVENCIHRAHYPTVFGRCVLQVTGLDTLIYPVPLSPASHPIEFATTPCTMAALYPSARSWIVHRAVLSIYVATTHFLRHWSNTIAFEILSLLSIFKTASTTRKSPSCPS